MASHGTESIDKINGMLEMVEIMQALGVSCDGLINLDQMKTRAKEEISKSQRESSWTAGQVFSVLSEAKEDDARKRIELQQLYSETEEFLKETDDSDLLMLKHHMGDFTDKFIKYKEELSRQDYFVLVAGETSAGKSSLLNPIPGEEVLSYSLLSTTSTICELKYGEDRRMVFSVLLEAKEDDARKRIELQQLYSETEEFLKEMDDSDLLMLKHHMGDFTDKIIKYKEELSRQDYFVLVAGETSAGKSSLLNLILGEEVLPYSLLSTTSTICELKYGEDRRMVAHFEDKDPDTGLPTKSIPLCGLSGEFSKETYLDQISRYVHVKKDRGRGSPFKKIEIFWPHSLLKEGIVIIDSPGVGESTSMDEMVMQYLSKAFAFIYVINSTNAGGVQRDRLVKLLEIVRRDSIEGQKEFPSKCALFVCNKWDRVPKKECEEVKAHVVEKLQECWPGLDPESQVIYMSTVNASISQSYGMITNEFECLINGIKSMMLRSIQARLEILWKWLDCLLARVMYQTKAFITNAASDHTEITQKMESIISHLDQIDREQISTIKKLQTQLKSKTDSAFRELSAYLKSDDVQTRFTCWTLDDVRVPQAEDSWKATENEITKVLENRLRDFIAQWEEENHLFADVHSSLERHFTENYNFVAEKLLKLQSRVTNNDTPVPDAGSSNIVGGDEGNLTTYDKVVLTVTSPIWIALGLVTLVFGAPVFGIVLIRDKLEDKSNLKKYKRDKCAFLAQRSADYLGDVVKDNVVRQYVEEHLKPTKLRLKQLQLRIPELIQADKQLCKQLKDEKRSKQPLYNKSSNLRGKLAVFGVKEVRPVDINCDELIWEEDSSPRLGIGAYGIVYQGKMTRKTEDQLVALKVLSEPLNVSNVGLFLAEEEILKKLDHPHVVKFYGTAMLKEMDQTRMILVMEKCKGSLKKHIFNHPEKAPGKSTSPAAKKDVIRWAKEIAEALHFIHEQGIVHRDLKLDNILLSEENDVKITDVGEAKKVEQITGTLIGTPVYIAPEVFHSKKYDSKADIYSFGILLWEMWYGQQAFAEGPMEMSDLFEQVDKGFRPPHEKDCKKPPPRWQQLMERCWKKQPEDRPTARECIEELALPFAEDD